MLIHASDSRWNVHMQASVSPMWRHEELHRRRLEAEFPPVPLENAPPPFFY